METWNLVGLSMLFCPIQHHLHHTSHMIHCLVIPCVFVLPFIFFLYQLLTPACVHCTVSQWLQFSFQLFPMLLILPYLLLASKLLIKLSSFELFSRSIQLSLGILLIGVGIATITDLQLNVLGSVLSLLAVLTTCVAQIVSLNKKIVYIADYNLFDTYHSCYLLSFSRPTTYRMAFFG